jgi:hypothetical protein
MTAYWRMRLKAGDYGEFSRRAWDRDEIGVWYGSWTAEDLKAASSPSSTRGEIAANLSALQAQRDLGWDVSASWVDTAQRFKRIASESSWPDG